MTDASCDEKTKTVGNTSAMYSDLIKVQLELPKVKKSKVANLGSRRYNYASLEDLIDIARPILNKNGFAVSQKVFVDRERGLCVETFLYHKTGGYLTSGVIAIPIPMQGNIAQAIGSARTYACRYSLASVLCLADTDDDDAQSYGEQQFQQQRNYRQQPQMQDINAQRQQILNRYNR